MKALNEITQEYGVHPVQVGQYEEQILTQAGELFESKRGQKPVNEHAEPERLYSEIGNTLTKASKRWTEQEFSGLDHCSGQPSPGDGQ